MGPKREEEPEEEENTRGDEFVGFSFRFLSFPFVRTRGERMVCPPRGPAVRK